MSNVYMKVMAVIMVAFMLLVMLVGCGKKTVSNQPTKESQSAAGQQSTTEPVKQEPEPLTLPIVIQPLTLTYFMRLNPKATATVKTYNEISCYKELEKRTGIHIEFYHPPLGKEGEQFNLMWASRQFPDLIWWETWINVPGGPQKAIDDGLIVSLNDLIKAYAPNITKLMNEEPQIRKDLMTDEGNIYCFPMLRYKQSMKSVWGFLIRQDWLDKLNLQTPTTVDEWYTVLKAFKEKDPNGNGKADEFPFSSQGMGRLVNWIWAWGLNYDFYNDNGVVKFGPVEAAYKDALTVLNKWYKEGLIDPDYVTNDPKVFDAKVMGNLVGSYYGETGGATAMYIKDYKDKDPSRKIVGVPFPVVTKGQPGYNYAGDVLFDGTGTAISTNNKYQKESVKWLDYGYSEEGGLLLNFGVEGISYTMVNGQPKLTELITNNPNGLGIDQALAAHALGAMQGPMVFDPRVRDQRMLFWPEQRESIEQWNKGDTSRRLPPLTPTQQESERIASIMNEINTYKDEMFNKFVMGQEPLENFDKYIETMKKMGIEEAIKLRQAELDRYNKRK